MFELLTLLVINLVSAHIYANDMVLASYVTNIVSHTILSTMSLAVLFTPISDMTPHDYDMIGEFEVVCGEWLKWYLVIDLFKMLTGVLLRYDSMYVLHHVFAITLVELIIRTGMLHYYLPVICIFEISSIPLNIRYALLHVNGDRVHVLYTEIAFVVSFFVFRLLYGFSKAKEAIDILLEIDNKTTEEWFVTVVVMVIVGVFIAMHAVWTVGIVQKVKKRKNM